MSHPSDEKVRLTLTISARLHAKLRACAELRGRLHPEYADLPLEVEVLHALIRGVAANEEHLGHTAHVRARAPERT